MASYLPGKGCSEALLWPVQRLGRYCLFRDVTKLGVGVGVGGWLRDIRSLLFLPFCLCV